MVLLLVVLPFVGFAQSQTVEDACDRTYADASGTSSGGPTLATFLCKIAYYINAVMPVLIALGVLYFIYGVITYVIASDEEAKTKGRDKIIAGLIGLLVIVSVWGLVSILRRSFAIQNEADISIPCIPAVGVDCPQGDEE